MSSAGSIKVPTFTVCLTAVEVERYRHAIGADDERVPLGLAMRTLINEDVKSRLAVVLRGRSPVHVAQAYKILRPLRVGVQYLCDVCLRPLGGNRFCIEQSLSDQLDQICLTVETEIILVTS